MFLLIFKLQFTQTYVFNIYFQNVSGNRRLKIISTKLKKKLINIKKQWCNIIRTVSSITHVSRLKITPWHWYTTYLQKCTYLPIKCTTKTKVLVPLILVKLIIFYSLLGLIDGQPIYIYIYITISNKSIIYIKH